MSTALQPDLRDSLITQLRERTTSPGFHYLDTAHLTELTQIESPGAPVVSVYMKLTPEMRVGDGWQIALKQTIKHSLQNSNGQHDHETVRKEFARVEEALSRGLPRTGRGLAIFACEEIGLFRQYGLAIETPTQSYVNRRPYVRPLVRLRDEHDRFGIVLVSQKQIRFFFSQIGLVEEVFSLGGREILTSDHQSKDQRQDKQSKYRREQARRAAHAVQLLADELDVRHIIYSAPEDMEGLFLDSLVQSVRNRIAAGFNCDINASVSEVAAKVEPHQREIERREELETVKQAQDQLTSKAVAGLFETIDMLNHGRVQKLILDDSLRLPGGVDEESGMLTTRTEGEHEVTGGQITAHEDLFAPMVERALDQSAKIELVRSEEARDELQKLGPCAVLLRF